MKPEIVVEIAGLAWSMQFAQWLAIMLGVTIAVSQFCYQIFRVRADARGHRKEDLLRYLAEHHDIELIISGSANEEPPGIILRPLT